MTPIEACIDVAHHICSAEGFGPPDTNADAVRELGRRGVISPDLADSLGRALGFRNVLVHQCTTVDDSVVLASLDDIGQLHEFVRQISRWMTAS